MPVSSPKITHHQPTHALDETPRSFEEGERLVSEHLARIAPDYAPKTLRCLTSDWGIFSAWCAKHELQALGSLVETVTTYIEHLVPGHSPATITRYLSTISHLHSAFGLTNPVHSPQVRQKRSELRRKDDTPNRKKPLRKRQINRMLKHLGDDPIDKRDRAILLVARDTLANRSTLVALLVDDILWEAPSGGAYILIRAAENEARSSDRLAWLSPMTRAALEDYLTAAAFEGGKLFRRFFSDGRLGDSLSAQSIARRFKIVAKEAGLDYENISGQSTRIGMALDLMGSGQTPVAVQQAGGWNSPSMPSIYARDLPDAPDSVARYYKRNFRR